MEGDQVIRWFISGNMIDGRLSGYFGEMEDAATSPINWALNDIDGTHEQIHRAVDHNYPQNPSEPDQNILEHFEVVVRPDVKKILVPSQPDEEVRNETDDKTHEQVHRAVDLINPEDPSEPEQVTYRRSDIDVMPDAEVSLVPCQLDVETRVLGDSVPTIELRKLRPKIRSYNEFAESESAEEFIEPMRKKRKTSQNTKGKNAEKFTCNICGKKFYLRRYLTRHLLLHSRSMNDRRIHKCDICEKRFVRRQHVNRHKYKVHKVHNNAKIKQY